MDHLPNDFFVTSQQFTRTVHRDQYPTIDPSSKGLAPNGNVVVVTGANRGLGRRASPSLKMWRVIQVHDGLTS